MEHHLKKMKTIQIPEDTHTLLKVFAAQKGKGIAEVVETSVKKYIKNKVSK